VTAHPGSGRWLYSRRRGLPVCSGSNHPNGPQDAETLRLGLPIDEGQLVAAVAPCQQVTMAETSLEVQQRQLPMGAKVDPPQTMSSASLLNTLIPINATSANPGTITHGVR
jgi:hypothetical protein